MGLRSLRFTLLLLSSLAVSPVAVFAQEPPPAPLAPPSGKAPAPTPGLPWKAAEAAGGRLEVLPTGMAVLHLSGTPEEMGRQQGTLLREPVRHLIANYLPRVLRGKREGALVVARALEKQIPERHRAEMAALAKAAELEYDDILLASVVVELLGLNQCSGFVAWGDATESGATIVGRTLEWPDHGLLGQYSIIVVAKPAGGRPYISVTFPGMVGVVTGMNGDGVFTSELVVLQSVDREKARGGVPFPILQRRILEECGTLDAAIALVRESPRTVAQNLLLAGPGDGAVLEVSVDRFVERKAVREGVVIVTNHFDEIDKPQKMDPRFKRMCVALEPAEGRERIDEASAEKTMRTTGMVAPGMNLQGGLFFPDSLRIRIAAGKPPACDDPLTELDGAALLGVVAPMRRGKDGEDAVPGESGK